MDLQGKAIHQARELDLLVVEPRDELAEFLLRRNDDPMLAAPLHSKALHDGLQVEHLLNVASNELPDLIDDEHECEPGPPALHQFARTLGELARCDVVLPFRSLPPGVG